MLAWRSILTLSPRLLQLRLDQPELNLRRDAQNRLWVAGMAIDLNDQGGPAPGLEHPALRWLTSQRELLIHGAVIRWQDELRQAPELTLRDVEFLARNGRLSHRFALRASAGEALARQLDLRAEFNRGLFSGDAGNPANWSGQLYLQADDLEPLAWSAWLPALPVAGRLSGRAWLQLDHGKFTELTSDLAVRGCPGRRVPRAALRGEYAQFRVQGLPGDFIQTDSLAWPAARARPTPRSRAAPNGSSSRCPTSSSSRPSRWASWTWTRRSRARMRATGSSTSPSCGSATTWTRACKANGAPRARPPPAAPTCAA